MQYFLEGLLNHEVDFFSTIEFRMVVNAPIAGLILLPLSLKRDMSSLAFAGVASLGALTYTLIVLIVETPFYYKENKNKPWVDIKPVILDWNFPTSCSLVFFAYTCQMSLLPIYSELVAPNYRRIKKVVNRSLAIDAFFYYLIASAGFFSMFNATSDVVLERPPLPSFDPDYFTLAAAVAICVVLFVAFPMNYNPCRNQFFLLAFNQREFSNKA